MKPTKKASPLLSVAIVVSLIGAGSTAGFLATRPDQQPSSPSMLAQETKPQYSMQDASKPTQAYKDGSYVASGSYTTPGGQESINLMVAISDNIVTSTELEQTAQLGETSSFYQSDFAQSYKEKVVGKSIDEIVLKRVAGSSLTSDGFNSALTQIKNEAKV